MSGMSEVVRAAARLAEDREDEEHHGGQLHWLLGEHGAEGEKGGMFS